ncbi:MAG: hypothetical protein HZA01_09130 [Nitrospinae bacterium]|nr:hypothetical protein [Nitrospinota bacterium]
MSAFILFLFLIAGAVVLITLPKAIQKKSGPKEKKSRPKSPAALPDEIRKKDPHRDRMRDLAMEDPEKLASMIKDALKKKDA